MAVVGTCVRLVLASAVNIARLAIVLIVLLTVAGSGPAPEHSGHDIDQLVAATQHQSIGTCHQAGYQCPLAVESEALWPHLTALAHRTQLRPSGDPLPYEFFQSFDTPPPRV